MADRSTARRTKDPIDPGNEDSRRSFGERLLDHRKQIAGIGAAIALGVPTLGSIVGWFTQRDRYSFEKPAPVAGITQPDMRGRGEFSVCYIGGVNSGEEKFQRHIDTLNRELIGGTRTSELIGFRNHSSNPEALDWCEIVSWNYPLEWVGIDDPVTGSMTSAIADYVLDHRTDFKYFIFIGHSQGSQMAKVAAEKVSHQDPELAARIGIVFIEPIAVGQPDNPAIVVERVAHSPGRTGHRLDHYLTDMPSIRTAFSKVKERLSEQSQAPVK